MFTSGVSCSVLYWLPQQIERRVAGAGSVPAGRPLTGCGRVLHVALVLVDGWSLVLGLANHRGGGRRIDIGQDAAGDSLRNATQVCEVQLPQCFASSQRECIGVSSHLHEVAVVLQHAAGGLPGVLVALPWVHPAPPTHRSVDHLHKRSAATPATTPVSPDPIG